MTYEELIASKERIVQDSGFEANGLNELLFGFQKFIVQVALKKGKFAIFADCGLGKTFMELEWSNKVVKHTEMDVLILCPLAVAGQTIQEGLKFGIEVRRWSNDEIYATDEGIYIANYEQLDNIDLNRFGGIVLDESSILKNYEGAIRNKIIDGSKEVPYKLACTATPSPNDPMELGNHAEFLDVMTRNQMLSLFFVHDGGETSKWRLKGHGHKIFWKFISSFSIMLSKPSDIGFDDEGYDLPKLNYIEHKILTNHTENGRIFNDVAVSATGFNLSLRLTKIDRLDDVAEIVNNSTENFIIWIKQNEEGEYLRKLIPEAIEVKGIDSAEYKESKLLGFAKNEFRVLITKTKIAQFGLNYQNCHNQIFPSIDFSFEGLYQAIRRSYRFGQKNTVNIYLITTDTMSNVLNAIKAKHIQFAEMQYEMTEATNINQEKTIKQKRVNMTHEHEKFNIQLGDCVQLIKNVPDESIGFSVFSPPFAELYTYSDELEDMGNSKNYQEFLLAFGFLVKELYRVIWSGRNVAVHCMDLPIQKGKEGYIGLRDFSNMIRATFEEAGFIYHSRVTIWKDPVVEMQRTKALGLLHKQVKKDAAMSRVGLPDYLLVFRKPGEHEHPVKCNISVDLWQKYASPVWYDIDYGNTLNGRPGRDERDEKHICPLQLETIERSIHLWSNEGDTVLTPFLGIGSEAFKAILMDRKAIGFELKKSYFDVAFKNCEAAVKEKRQALIFS